MTSGFSVVADHHDAKSCLHIFQCMQSLTFLQLYEHCKCNYASDTHGQVHVHAGMAYKFNHYMHACIIILKHCHIVAVGMTLLQLPNSLSSIYIIESVVCAKNVVYPEALP